MKKLLVAALVLSVFAALPSAAINLGLGVPLLLTPAVVNPMTTANAVEPNLVIGINDLDLIAGFSSIAQGTGVDAQTNILVGGAYYLLKNDAVSAGPSLFYVSTATNTNNSLNNIMLGFSAKANLVNGVALRADAIIYNMVSGKIGGVDIKDVDQILPYIQTSIVMNIL